MKKYYHLFGIIILIFILSRIDFQKLIAYCARLNFMRLGLVSLIILPTIFLKAYRWRYLLRLQKIDYGMRSSFVSYLGGIYAGIVTPGRVGETIKALYLKHDKNISFSEAVASVFVDRLFDLYLLFLLGTMGFLHLFYLKNNKYGILIPFVATILLSFLFTLLTRVSILDKISKAIYKRMISGLDESIFEGQFKSFFSNVKKIISQGIYFAFFLTIAAYLLYFFQCYLLARIAAINISYAAVVYFVSISGLISILPISILGIGTREASLVYLFALVGLNAESAVTYSFLLFFSFYVLSGILAFLGWSWKGKRVLLKR